MSWDIRGKRVFMTGATSGLGVVVLAELYRRGAHVSVACRSVDKAREVTDKIESGYEGSSGSIDLVQCDLASLSSVAHACADYNSNNPKLDVLINNAGVWNSSFRRTVDGIEEVLAVNLLAPSLIIESMRSRLKAAGEARVITTTSGLHQGKISFDDLEWEAGYSGWRAYRQSKLGVILITRWLAREQGDTRVTYNCVHPGVIRTDLARNQNIFLRALLRLAGAAPRKGAGTIAYLATADGAGAVTGEYWYRNKTGPVTRESKDQATADRLRDAVMGYLRPYLD